MLKLTVTFLVNIIALLTFAQKADTFKISGTIISANTGKNMGDWSCTGIITTPISGDCLDSMGNFTVYGLANRKVKLTFTKLFEPDTFDTVVYIANADVTGFKWIVTPKCTQCNDKTALRDID